MKNGFFVSGTADVFSICGGITLKGIIFSDTHGKRDGMLKVLDISRDADAVFFLGDGLNEAEEIACSDRGRTWFAVRGNCDSQYSPLGMDRRDEELVSLCGVKILICHGHLYNVKYGLGQLISAARRTSADAVLFGHTHEPLCEYISDYEKPFWLFNPGSLSRPASGRGSFGVICIEQGKILLSHGVAI